MKGTIALAKSQHEKSQALIPVPMKGTITTPFDKDMFCPALIPVPMKGTMAKLHKTNNNFTVLFRKRGVEG